MPPLSPFNKKRLSIAIVQVLTLPAAQAATITVNTSLDTGAGCSLREAISSINAGVLSGCAKKSGDFRVDDTINITPLGSTLLLQSGLGSLTIDEDVTINGPSGGFTISAQNQFRVLRIDDARVNLNNLSVVSGHDTTGGGLLIISGAIVTMTNCTVSSSTGGTAGGGIYVDDSNLELVNSTISNNLSATKGGGVAVDGDLSRITLVDSAVSNNRAYTTGGGLDLNESRGSLTNSTVSGNTVDFGSNKKGGGIYLHQGSMTLDKVTVSGNSSKNYGGGLFSSDARMTLINSTISGNASGNHGAGLAATGYSSVRIVNSTVFNNSSTSGVGGIFAYETNLIDTPSITLENTIVSGNQGGSADEIGTFLGNVYTNNANLFGHDGISNGNAFTFFLPGDDDITATSDGSHPTIISDILDTSLSNNGGLTRTHALIAASPAIDVADTTDCPNVDQRSKPRDTTGLFFPIVASDENIAVVNLGGECDIGSVELSLGD